MSTPYIETLYYEVNVPYLYEVIVLGNLPFALVFKDSWLICTACLIWGMQEVALSHVSSWYGVDL